MVLLVVNLVLSVFFGLSAATMLSTISTMQVASLLPLSTITVPSNAMSFYKIMVTFIAFDFLPQADFGFTP